LVFVRHLHLELCQIARELNTIFGPQMTMEIAVYLISVTRLCGYIYMHIQTKGRYVRTAYVWFGMSFWVVVHLVRLFSLNYICEKISAKVNIHICVTVYIYVHMYTHTLKVYIKIFQLIYIFTYIN